MKGLKAIIYNTIKYLPTSADNKFNNKKVNEYILGVGGKNKIINNKGILLRNR